MPINKKESSYILNLDIPSEIRGSDRDELLSDIKEFIVTEIITQVEAGHSPVKGVGDFAQLTKAYANREKGGDTQPNLDLNGDMLNSLVGEVIGRNKIKVGIFAKESGEDSAIKAFAHNTGFKGHPNPKLSKNPKTKRQFIPNPSQEFEKSITRSIKDIIAEKLAEVKDNG
jgi:hypothetical protein